MIVFDRIEVVNRLKKEYVYETIKNYSINYDKIWIYDKIHHEINQFCTKHTLKEVYTDLFDNLDESLIMALAKDCEIWAPGIEIIAIRVTKPRIPERIKKNFEEMESQRTKLLVVIENQKLRMQEAETQKRQELIKTQSAFEVSKINIEREIQEQLNKQKLAKMENENYLKKIISEANAQHYIANKELETVQQRLTGRYLMHEAIESLTNNLKLNIGNNIPEAIIQNDQEFDMLNVFGKKVNSKNIQYVL